MQFSLFCAYPHLLITIWKRMAFGFARAAVCIIKIENYESWWRKKKKTNNARQTQTTIAVNKGLYLHKANNAIVPFRFKWIKMANIFAPLVLIVERFEFSPSHGDGYVFFMKHLSRHVRRASGITNKLFLYARNS